MQGQWFAELEAPQKLAPGLGGETEAQRGPELVQGAEIQTQLSLTPCVFPAVAILRGAGWVLWGSWADSSPSTHFTERKTEAQGREVSGRGEKGHYNVVTLLSFMTETWLLLCSFSERALWLTGTGSPKECVVNE